MNNFNIFCSYMKNINKEYKSKTKDNLKIKEYYTFLENMLNEGFNINETDKNGDNLLIFTIYMNSLELTKFLIKKGIDVNNKTNSGLTPIQIASEMKDRYRIIKLLKDCKRNKKSEFGDKIIEEIIEPNNDENILDLLLENGLKSKNKIVKTVDNDENI